MALVQILFFSAVLIGLTKCYAPFHDPNFAPGHDVIVHLFEWRWEDIADECERFLSPMGYGGVQVSPPSENAIIENENGVTRPWYERYQPVSYKLVTRSGNEEQFKAMVDRCNKVGIRIYVDAVINHMAGNLPDGSRGTAGSQFNVSALTFDAVPYGPEDFNSVSCKSGSGNIEDYSDVNQVRNCRLVGLSDLNLSRENVRKSIADYLNYLLDIGVAGFRIDAAKHMWPGDLAAIYGSLNNLSLNYFQPNTRPFIYQEVIDQGHEAVSSLEYVTLGRVTEFKYGMKLGAIIKGTDQLRYAENFGEDWGFINSDDALVFVDNHDNQRGHGGGGDILNFFSPDLYKKAVVFMLSWPYGVKQVMSSFRWNRDFQNGEDINNWVGPPHDENYNTLPVEIATDGSCNNGWVCEHRWPQIAQMVRFSIITQSESTINWWDNEYQQIAFSRGDKGFVAINNEDSYLTRTLDTSLPPGHYCDIMTNTYIGNNCTGRMFTVNSDNTINLNLPNGMVALHVQAMLPEMPTSPSTEESSSDFQRTVLFLKINDFSANELQENVFIRGGVTDSRVKVCQYYGFCAIPIQHASNSSWRVGDTELDWNGKETGQAQNNMVDAQGTPLFISSNDKESQLYHPENVFGDNLWTLDVMMDCGKTDSGWFEFKAYLPIRTNFEWEKDIYQENSCTGNTYKAQLPFFSNNHLAMCGKVNYFTFEKNACLVQELNN